MRPKSLPRLLLAMLLASAANNLHAADEAELIARLQSAAGVPEKCAACQELRIIGTARSVPALAALLAEDRTAHAARYALEAIPGPEADAALRAALGKTAGLLKVGVIDSLGRRRDLASLPLLKPLLADGDPAIAAHAAAALGRIGGKEALAALFAARAQSPPAVQAAVADALLQCAARLLSDGDRRGAAIIYRRVFEADLPPPIRSAGWRGLVLSDPAQRVDLMSQALGGSDPLTYLAALTLLRELGDAQVIRAGLKQWAQLSAEAQAAVLDASLKLGAKALPTVRAAAASAHPTVRMAAWQALAGLEDASLLPALARAAAGGAPAERDAARDALTRLRGPGVDQAIRQQISQGDPPVKTELLLALGERGDPAAAAVLLTYTTNANETIRLAALKSLKRLAVPTTLTPLLDLAAKSKSQGERTPVLEALTAICQASPDKDQATRGILGALERLPAAERGPLLPLLAEVATPAALASVEAASRSAEAALAREGIRALTQWPNAAAAPALLALARSSAAVTQQRLALSGCIQVAEQEPDFAKRLALLQRALMIATRSEEKKQALGQLGQIPTPAALQVALAEVTDTNLATEAGLAAVNIAEKLAGANPQLAEEAAVTVLAQSQSPDVLRRAWALRRKPKIDAPFIRDWLVCGPYRQPGAVGAEAVFDLAFGPEKPGEPVPWKTLPRADHANLAAFFPGQDNCAAYLQARIVAPQDCQATLLVGSDDGVKAWLNGKLVHGHNIDRGMVPDQDLAPIELKKGTNQLRLKITQGGGGWMACARIVGTDGQPIAGLRVEPPGAP